MTWCTEQEDESLYDWMKRKQQIGDVGAAADDDNQVTITVKEKELPSAAAAAANTANDDELKREKESAAAVPETPPATPQQTKSMHLLDAHIIFEPLLSRCEFKSELQLCHPVVLSVGFESVPTHTIWI